MSRFAVQHLVMSRITRRYPPPTTSDLLGVSYAVTAPADTEFPWTIRRVDLFTRFFLTGARLTWSSVRL